PGTRIHLMRPRRPAWTRTTRSSRSCVLYLLRLLAGLFNGSHVQEGLLGKRVALSVDDLAEALHRVGYLHVPAGKAGELLCHEEGLAEETLDAARPCHRG